MQEDNLRKPGTYWLRKVSIGSSDAARRAGQNPKNTPTKKATSIASSVEAGLTIICIPRSWPTSHEPPTPSRRPSPQLKKRKREAFDHELHQHIAAVGADRHACADFAGTFGDRYPHDVPDADAAHHQGNGGNRTEQITHDLGCASLGFCDGGEFAHGKVVLHTFADTVPAAQQVGDRRFRHGLNHDETGAVADCVAEDFFAARWTSAP